MIPLYLILLKRKPKGLAKVLLIKLEEEEEELRSLKEVGVNKVFPWPRSKDNDVRCETTSPLARNIHYI